MDGKRRRIWLLVAFTLLALVLRLTGITWGWVGSNSSLHPDEWTWRYIDALGHGDISPLWGYGWYTSYWIIGGLYWLFLKALYAVVWLVGAPRSPGEVGVDVLIFGRVIVAVSGALTVPLVYRVGQRVFRDPWVALVAAALLAVAPVHVVNAHYLETDAPLAFMATLALLAAARLWEIRRPLNALVAGLALGLTLTTKPNGVVVLVTLLLALILAKSDETRLLVWTPRRWMGHGFLLLLGAIVGVAVGFPSLVLDFDGFWSYVLETSQWMTTQRFVSPGSWWEGPMADRMGWALQTLLDGYGLIPLLLALGIGVWALIRPHKPTLLVVSFPIAYLTSVILWGTRFGERDATVLMPFLALLSAAGLVRALELIKSPRWKRIGFALGIIVVLTYPLWKSLEMAYYFWMPDNRILAGRWMEASLPKGIRIHLDRYPPYLERGDYRIIEERDPGGVDILVTSSGYYTRYFKFWTGRTYHTNGRWAREVPARFELLKSFDFKYDRFPGSEFSGFIPPPHYVDSLIRIYRAVSPPSSVQPVFFFYPAMFTYSSYEVEFLKPRLYGKRADALWVQPFSQATRVLKTPNPMETVGVWIRNGRVSSTIRIRSGLSWGERVKLRPREERLVIVQARQWPPFTRYAYPVSVSNGSGDPVFIRILPTARERGEFLLAREQPQKALKHLYEALKEAPEEKDLHNAVGLAHAMLNELSLAEPYFRNGREMDAVYQGYVEPGASEKLRSLSGVDLGFLRQTLQYVYSIHPPPQNQRVTSFETRGEEFKAQHGRRGAHWQNFRLKSAQGFSVGDYVVRFTYRLADKGKTRIRMLVLHNEHNKALVQLAVREVELAHSRGVQEGMVRFRNPVDGWRLEFLLKAEGQADVIVEQVKVELDFSKIVSRRWGLILAHRARAAWTREEKTEVLEDIRRAQILLRPLAEGPPVDGPVLEALIWCEERLGDRREADRLGAALKAIRPSRPSEIIFSNGMRFLGLNLSPPRVSAGGNVAITYYWALQVRPLKGVQTFVHFVKESEGEALFQDDHGFSVSPRKWRMGEVIRVSREVKIPKDTAPGTYRIRLGLWHPKEQGQREAVIQAERPLDRTSAVAGLLEVE